MRAVDVERQPEEVLAQVDELAAEIAGADTANGSGLRGLADRVEALGARSKS